MTQAVAERGADEKCDVPRIGDVQLTITKQELTVDRKEIKITVEIRQKSEPSDARPGIGHARIPLLELRHNNEDTVRGKVDDAMQQALNEHVCDLRRNKLVGHQISVTGV